MLEKFENNYLLYSINSDFTDNSMLDFVLTSYNYVKLIISKYSHEYSKQFNRRR